MEPAGRARGRARGRSRPQAAQAPQAGPPPVAPSVAASSSSSASSSTPSAVGRAGARSKPAEAARELPRQMQGLSVRSDSGTSGAGSSGGNGNGNGGNGSNGNGNGNGEKAVGRFSVRGGRDLYDNRKELCTRPESVSNKKGSSGQPTKIQTNLFKLETTPTWELNKYHVDFNPAEDRTFIRKVMMREHEKVIGKYMFDGSTLFSIQRLCTDKPRELFSVRQSDNEKIRITIKHVGTVTRNDYQYLQVLNIILRDCSAKLNLQQIRRNYFDKNAAVTIREHNLELWPGYITNIGQFEQNICLQAEIVYKVLRRDTAYDLFRELAGRGGDRSFQTAFSSAIIGTIVLTTYNDKTYRVDDVSYTDTPLSTFKQKTKDGDRHVSYQEYFLTKYKVKINDPRQPMLISRSSARDKRAGMPELVYLVPELSVMTGLNDNMRSNYQLMRAVAEHTAVAPADRVRRLLDFNRRMTSVPEIKQKLSDWGMRLSPNLAETDGRILPQETIYVHEKKFFSGPEVDWTRNLRSSKMLHSAVLSRWVLVYPTKIDNVAKTLYRLLVDSGKGMAFEYPKPIICPIQSDNASAYIQALDRAINENNPELVVCIVPNNRSDRYSAIKKKCIVDKPVPSQVVLQKNVLAKSAMSIATKITVQINCKIGGSPWTIDNPLKGVMIIGFDVCHDSRDKRKSYGAMVASLDPAISRYYSTLNHHAAGDELSSSFAINITKAVHRYRQINNKLPTPIVVYRDGVGEGDLRYVLEQEVSSIKEALGKIYAAEKTELRFAFIVVTKRINTRLFNNGKNPPPGTVVDDVVTNPLRYDFYLVSQSVRQGTVSPTHYNVIADTSALKVDHIQRLTYKLTHMYFNWSGTVRVPAPCQYAHKLAFLTAQSVGCAHSNLDQLLYFL